MAKQALYGQFFGKMGEVVGKRGIDGKYSINPVVTNISNPRTAAQMAVRARLALAGKMSSMLGILGDQINIANGYSPSRKGLLNRQLMANMTTNQLGDAVLNRSLNLIKSPNNAGAWDGEEMTLRLIAPTAQSSGQAIFNFKYVAAATQPLLRLVACIMVYDATNDRWASRSITTASEAGAVAVNLDSTYLGAAMYAYAFVMAVEVEQGSALALEKLAGNDESFTVALNSAIASGRLCYSQVYSDYAHV